MKCPGCGKEMMYFKDWEKVIDGYRCECGEEKIIKAFEIEGADSAAPANLE